MMLISPSRLAIEAAGFRPTGLPAKSAGRCQMCGHTYVAGDLIVDAELPDTFTNWGELASAGSPHICGHCAAVCQAPWLQAWMNAVICEKGVFKFSSNADIAYWLLNPPEGPFVMTRGDQQKQHLVWRTPVNYSRDVYQVRIGEKMVTIRRAQLIEARDAAIILSERINASREEKPKPGRKPATDFTNPFTRPFREMDNVSAGRFRQEALNLAGEDSVSAAMLDTLRGCTPGEIWALTAVLYAEPSMSPTPHELKPK